MIVLILAVTILTVSLLTATWANADLYLKVLCSILVSFPVMLFFEQLRFALPIRWRVLSPKVDSLLCKIGSHRCVPICGSLCCWECIRCEKDSPSVKAYFERLERMRK